MTQRSAVSWRAWAQGGSTLCRRRYSGLGWESSVVFSGRGFLVEKPTGTRLLLSNIACEMTDDGQRV